MTRGSCGAESNAKPYIPIYIYKRLPSKAMYAYVYFLCPDTICIYNIYKYMSSVFISESQGYLQVYIFICYYFGILCRHNYCTMLNIIIMALECSVSNPFRKQLFHQDHIDLRNLIIYIHKIFFKF